MTPEQLKRNLFAGYVNEIILGTFFQLPIWIVYQSQFMNFEQIAFFSAMALIIEVAMQIPTGAFADLFGRKYSLGLGNLFMALPMFLLAFYPHIEIMWLYSFMYGLGRAFCTGINKSIIYESLSLANQVDRFPQIISRLAVSFQVSAAISIVAGGYLYQIYQPLPYIVLGAASMLGLFSIFLFNDPQVTQKVFNIKKFLQTNLEGFKDVFRNSYITKLTLLYAIMYGIGSANQKFFSQPYMVELGMNDLERSWLAMLIKLTIALFGAWLISKKKFLNHRVFMLFLPILMVITLIPAPFVVLPFAYLIFIGIAFVSGNSNVFLGPEINKNISSKLRATAISAQNMLASMVSAIVQGISGPIIIASSIGTFYMYLGVFSLVFILPLAWMIVIHQDKLKTV